MAWLAFLHTPIVAEQALPFAVLLGSMIAFLNLSRRLELVVARAAGRFGLAISRARRWSVAVAHRGRRDHGLQSALDRDEAAIGRDSRPNSSAAGGAGDRRLWLRQQERRRADDRPRRRPRRRRRRVRRTCRLSISTPTAHSLNASTPSAPLLRDGYWELHDVDRGDAGLRRRRRAGVYLLATNADAHARSRRPSSRRTPSRSWRLRALAEQVERAGLDATPIACATSSLIAMPALLAAMVLVASCFSLRLFRMGGVQKMVSGGVGGGLRALCRDEDRRRSRRRRSRRVRWSRGGRRRSWDV